MICIFKVGNLMEKSTNTTKIINGKHLKKSISKDKDVETNFSDLPNEIILKIALNDYDIAKPLAQANKLINNVLDNTPKNIVYFLVSYDDISLKITKELLEKRFALHRPIYKAYDSYEKARVDYDKRYSHGFSDIILQCECNARTKNYKLIKVFSKDLTFSPKKGFLFERIAFKLNPGGGFLSDFDNIILRLINVGLRYKDKHPSEIKLFSKNIDSKKFAKQLCTLDKKGSETKALDITAKILKKLGKDELSTEIMNVFTNCQSGKFLKIIQKYQPAFGLNAKNSYKLAAKALVSYLENSAPTMSQKNKSK
jgi:hypothetical protein